eukprot:13794464-Alexandrium_andersonii.AAC.1
MRHAAQSALGACIWRTCVQELWSFVVDAGRGKHFNLPSGSRVWWAKSPPPHELRVLLEQVLKQIEVTHLLGLLGSSHKAVEQSLSMLVAVRQPPRQLKSLNRVWSIEVVSPIVPQGGGALVQYA